MKSLRHFTFLAFLQILLFLAVLNAVPGVVFAEDPPPPATEGDGKYDDIILLAPLPGMQRDEEGRGKIELEDKDAIDIMATYTAAVYKFGLALLAIYSIIMFMISGYEYMFAGGDSGKTENAKNRSTRVLAGLVLAFLSALLLNIVNPTFFKL